MECGPRAISGMTDQTSTSSNNLPVPGGSSKDLSSLLKELAALRPQLAQRELDLVTAGSALEAFKTRYYAEVGSLQAELGELEAQVVEVLARRRPSDPSLRKEASEARQQARECCPSTTTPGPMSLLPITLGRPILEPIARSSPSPAPGTCGWWRRSDERSGAQGLPDTSSP